jgi:hypothetical protein
MQKNEINRREITRHIPDVQYPAQDKSKREALILWKNVSATYVGIDQGLLRTHPNFVRRAISYFVRAHHGKIRRYRRSCKAPRKTPQIVLPFRCSLVRWLKHARACLFLCAGGLVGSICPLNFTMLLLVTWCCLHPFLLPFLPPPTPIYPLQSIPPPPLSRRRVVVPSPSPSPSRRRRRRRCRRLAVVVADAVATLLPVVAAVACRRRAAPLFVAAPPPSSPALPMSSQPRGHVYRRNGVDSDDDSYRVDDYYAGLYDEWADGGYQEFQSDGEEQGQEEVPEYRARSDDLVEQEDDRIGFVDSGTEIEIVAGESGDGLDESGDGLDESDGVDADEHTARVLFGTPAREEYDDLHDVDVPAEHQRVIISALAHHGIANPRDFQIEAIYHLGFNLRPVTVVISKTGSGKTAIPLVVGRLRRGISLFMVPLIGLGCDLVEKFNNYHHDVEAYHLDEHRDAADVDALLLRLSGLTLSRTVYLFVSPQTLSSSSKWWKPLMKLSKGGLMALICIDEAHEVAQQGRSFRPEFIEAVRCLNVLFAASSRPLPRILMSATIQNSDVDFLLRELRTDRTDPNVGIFWQKMNRRSISIDVFFLVILL